MEIEVNKSTVGLNVLLAEIPQERALAAPCLPEHRDMQRAAAVGERDMTLRYFIIDQPIAEIEASMLPLFLRGERREDDSNSMQLVFRRKKASMLIVKLDETGSVTETLRWQEHPQA